MKKKIIEYANSFLEKFDIEIIRKSESANLMVGDIFRKPSFAHSSLPDDVKRYLSPDNPLLIDLKKDIINIISSDRSLHLDTGLP